MANALTALRLLLAVPFAFLMLRSDVASAWGASALYCVAIATDLLDGPIARRRGRASARGRLLDHTSDFAFVSAGLFAMALGGAITLWLPALVTVAFAQYVIDSYGFRAERELRISALGRANGVLYFVPPGGELLLRTGLLDLLALGFLAEALPWIPWIAWILVATTLLSMADRALAERASRRARGWRGAGTADRSPR